MFKLMVSGGLAGAGECCLPLLLACRLGPPSDQAACLWL